MLIPLLSKSIPAKNSPMYIYQSEMYPFSLFTKSNVSVVKKSKEKFNIFRCEKMRNVYSKICEIPRE